MSSYTNIFTSALIQTSDTSINQFDLQGDYTFVWPTQFVDISQETVKVLATTVIINPLDGVSSLSLPDATLATPGSKIYMSNRAGGFTFNLYAFDGQEVVVADFPGAATLFVTLTDNTTSNGVWQVVSIEGGNVAPSGTFGNINISGNNIISINTNGDINMLPNGTGSILLRGIEIDNANAVTGITSATIGNFTIAANTFTADNVNGGFTFSPSGNGDITLRDIVIDNQNNITEANSAVIGSLSIGLVDDSTISSVAGGNIILAPDGAGLIRTNSNAAAVFEMRTGAPILFYNSANTFYSGINASDDLAQNLTWELPIVDAQIPYSSMTSNGGILTFSAIPGKNILINPEAQIAQRGAGGAATFNVASNYIYGPDRWQFGSVPASGTVAQCLQTAVPPFGKFYYQVGRPAADTGLGVISFAQSMPTNLCNDINGYKLTLSFMAYAGANYSSAANALNILLVTGTGNVDSGILTTPFTGQVSFYSTSVTLTVGTTAYYTVTSAVVVPANVTQAAVKFFYTPTGVAGADDNFYVTNIQLERGGSASPYASLGFDKDRQACLPFYQKSFDYNVAPAQNSGDTNAPFGFIATVAGASVNYAPTVFFQSQMHSTPSTVTTYNPSAANAFPRKVTTIGGAAGDFSTVSVSSKNEKGFIFNGTGPATTGVGDFCSVHWTADADLY